MNSSVISGSPETYSKPCQASKDGTFRKNSSWVEAVNYFRKKTQLRCVSGF